MPSEVWITATSLVAAPGRGAVPGTALFPGFAGPFEPSGLQRIAQMTDGRYFQSTGDEELRRVYQQLGRVIGWERTRTEVAFLLVGVAGLFLLTGGTLSMIWFRRVP